jgi:hypothetical protein
MVLGEVTKAVTAFNSTLRFCDLTFDFSEVFPISLLGHKTSFLRDRRGHSCGLESTANRNYFKRLVLLHLLSLCRQITCFCVCSYFVGLQERKLIYSKQVCVEILIFAENRFLCFLVLEIYAYFEQNWLERAILSYKLTLKVQIHPSCFFLHTLRIKIRVETSFQLFLAFL